MVHNLSFSTKPRIGCMCKKLSFYGVLGRCGHDRKNILPGSPFKPGSGWPEVRRGALAPRTPAPEFHFRNLLLRNCTFS
jgi:hypothetical protein